MAQVNKCLGVMFATYNSIFLSLGFIALLGALKGASGLTWNVFVFIGATIGISSLGIFGVRKVQKWALMLYSVLVSLGMVYCLYMGVVLVVNKSEVMDDLADTLGDEFEVYQKFIRRMYDHAVGIFFCLAVAAFLGVAMAVQLLRQMSGQEGRPSAPMYIDTYKDWRTDTCVTTHQGPQASINTHFF